MRGSASALDVAVEVVTEASEPSDGWVLVAPSFEVTARERGRAVSKLTDSLELRFAVEGPATVLFYDGEGWEIIESTLEDGGTVSANIDHLSRYSAGKPANAGSLPDYTVPEQPERTAAAGNAPAGQPTPPTRTATRPSARLTPQSGGVTVTRRARTSPVRLPLSLGRPRRDSRPGPAQAAAPARSIRRPPPPLWARLSPVTKAGA